MPGRGGRRCGSGRKRLTSPQRRASSEKRSSCRKKWNEGHCRVYFKKDILEEWKSLKASGVYSTDSMLAQHLLTLEMQRRQRLPQRKENIKHVEFNTSTYDTWVKKKFEMGCKEITNSEFAEVLLHHLSAKLRDPATNFTNTKSRAFSCNNQAERTHHLSPVPVEENMDDGNDVDVVVLSEEEPCCSDGKSPTPCLQDGNPMHGFLSGSSLHIDQSVCMTNDRQLPQDDAASVLVKVEMVADSEDDISWRRRDMQRSPSTADSEMKLSEYVTMTKGVFLCLMFRCLECSSECQIRWKDRGGNLSFRQECLICCNYTVWTCQAPDAPNDKWAEWSPSGEAHETSGGIPVIVDQEHITGNSKPTYKNNSEVAEDSISVKEERGENEREEELSLLMETYEDSDEEHHLNLAPIWDETNVPAYPESSDVNSTTEDLLIDECSSEELAGKACGKSSEKQQEKDNVSAGKEIFTDEEESDDKSFEKTQQEDSNELQPSPSDKPREKADETSDTGIIKKPFQNTIKPVVWCINCKTVSKMFCVIQRHEKYFCCPECASGGSVENLSFKDFSVYFTDARSFRLHVIAVHCANLIEHEICQDCNKTIRVETDPSEKGHVCESKSKPFSCDMCQKRFITEIGRKVHYRRLHRDYQHTCKYCMDVFNTKQSKLEHEQSHNEDTLYYTCPNCPEKFTDFFTRNEHLKTHPEKKHVCSICSRKFTELYRYERHLLIHSGEKPYKCDVCERSFNQDGHLKSHMRVHTGEKPFLCEHCGESFNHNISLRNHRQRQHGITNSSSVPGEENKQIGRPIRNEDQPRRQSKMNSADEEMESCESDSDEEQKKRGWKRKGRRKEKQFCLLFSVGEKINRKSETT